MIKVFLHPRFIRELRKLSEAEKESIQAALSSVMQDFGNPHQHGGIGLRKLGNKAWECRIGIDRRIVFERSDEGLVAFGIMNHDQVRTWVRNLK